MKLCIATIIKDEQLYLDNFIDYHLKLGIDHIFIFEDVDSSSHKDITDFYEDKVTLLSVRDLFPSELSIKPTQLNAYIRMLGYIKLNYPCDWCFGIDVDEYITLALKRDKLEDVMSRYSNYTALLLKCVNYGADGRVSIPNYSRMKITDAFTKKCSPMKVDNEKNTTKIAYNMNVFNKSFIYNHHITKDDVGWCFPNFTRDLKKPSCEKIYIRHYITKSWMEYVWKMECRGQYTFHTTYDSFFEANRDMIGMKDELMSQIDSLKERFKMRPLKPSIKKIRVKNE